jgi:hypothetical protein
MFWKVFCCRCIYTGENFRKVGTLKFHWSKVSFAKLQASRNIQKYSFRNFVSKIVHMLHHKKVSGRNFANLFQVYARLNTSIDAFIIRWEPITRFTFKLSWSNYRKHMSNERVVEIFKYDESNNGVIVKNFQRYLLRILLIHHGQNDFSRFWMKWHRKQTLQLSVEFRWPLWGAKVSAVYNAYIVPPTKLWGDASPRPPWDRRLWRYTT